MWDGILDPTEVFADIGYELDFPNRTLGPLTLRPGQGRDPPPPRLPETKRENIHFVQINGREPGLD
jgi:hypothetical protein